MRVKVRKKVDITKTPNMSELGGLQKIITAIRYKYSTSSMYKSMKEKEENKKLEIRMRRTEELKNILLYNITNSLKRDGSNYRSIRLSISREFEDIIQDTIGSVDFLAYDIDVVKENKDYLIAFPHLPILLDVRRKM